MDVLEAIYTRRSVRRYKSVMISDDNIEALLLAAMSAPSAGNQQPWHFILVDDRKTLERIQQIQPYTSMCKEVPFVIITCIDFSLEKHKGMAVQDLSAATENILIAARGLGLGAVWMGVYPRVERSNKISEIFSLPDNIVPFSLIPVGHTKVLQERVSRYRGDRIHKNSWN